MFLLCEGKRVQILAFKESLVSPAIHIPSEAPSDPPPQADAHGTSHPASCVVVVVIVVFL